MFSLFDPTLENPIQKGERLSMYMYVHYAI